MQVAELGRDNHREVIQTIYNAMMQDMPLYRSKLCRRGRTLYSYGIEVRDMRFLELNVQWFRM